MMIQFKFNKYKSWTLYPGIAKLIRLGSLPPPVSIYLLIRRCNRLRELRKSLRPYLRLYPVYVAMGLAFDVVLDEGAIAIRVL